ncbi:MAG: MXAN_5187 C-terminal domain-containing protein [Candidatus Korobacteraceae bacterium]
MATVEENLNLLEDAVRRLKIEYDIFFGGGSKRPPNDLEWKVQTFIRRLEIPKLTFAQRFRYTSIVQKYAVFSDLWRQKMKIKEEGYRRPQDALLAIQGLRDDHAPASPKPRATEEATMEPFRVACSNPEQERETVRSLFSAMTTAKRKAGEEIPDSSFESFQAFLKRKTEQIRKDFNCQAVEYAVEVNRGRVRLKAKAKDVSGMAEEAPVAAKD